MNTFLENQNWRYATKKFDTIKKISDKDIYTLKEAIRLTPSSFGLQPYKVIFVESPKLRTKLKGFAWEQSQIVDASHLIVFAIDTNINDSKIEDYMKNIGQTRGRSAESLVAYGNRIKNKIAGLTPAGRDEWATNQTYIALGTLLYAAAHLKIDVTPIGGFEPARFNEVLGLDALHLSASVIAPLGYRHEEDATQHYKKVRKSHEELFITL